MSSDESARTTPTAMADIKAVLSENLEAILSEENRNNVKVEPAKQINPGQHCLWHRKGRFGHKNNFGLMGECKDCLREIKDGRCVVDVCNFDLDVYWTVRTFWQKVDIRGENDCWPWMGATRRDGMETIAYMPSPFHSAKTQSAPRVAFWLSRGYTGRYRIFHQEGCSQTCCNPLHLRIKDLGLVTNPTKIERVNLSYGNIFERAKNDIQEE